MPDGLEVQRQLVARQIESLGVGSHLAVGSVSALKAFAIVLGRKQHRD